MSSESFYEVCCYYGKPFITSRVDFLNHFLLNLDLFILTRYGSPLYVENQLTKYRSIIPQIQALPNKTLDKPAFVVATHSTGILDLALASNIPLLISTSSWGNYFELTGPGLFCY